MGRYLDAKLMTGFKFQITEEMMEQLGVTDYLDFGESLCSKYQNLYFFYFYGAETMVIGVDRYKPETQYSKDEMQLLHSFEKEEHFPSAKDWKELYRFGEEQKDFLNLDSSPHLYAYASYD